MSTYWSKQSAIIATLTLMVACPTTLRAQDTGSSMPAVPQQAAAALTGDQQSAATFAGSTHLPLPDSTNLLKGYVAQHATDILASCAASNATSGLTSKLPGASSMPSVPKWP